jgi:hypothetical protein
MKAVLTLDNGRKIAVDILPRLENSADHAFKMDTNVGLWKSLTRRSHAWFIRW